MKAYIKKNGILMGIIAFLVAIIVAVGVNRSGGDSGLFKNATGALRMPVQRAVSAVAGYFESLYGYIYDYDQIKAERDELEKRLAEAEEKLSQANEALEENERLRDLLEFGERHRDFKYETSRIVSWNASNWASTFTISKGGESGIELGDPVITEEGALVGQIIELGDNWSTVRTVADIDTSIGALVGEAGNAAMIIGDFSLMQENKIKLTYLTEGTQLLIGDPIYTSGRGGSFPQGLLIGSIYSVAAEGGQTLYGIIDPACDLTNLAQVFIITEYEIVE